MSAIKNFFKKRKQDVHFAAAGPGRRLCDSSPRPSGPPPTAQPVAPRAAPSESAQRAAAAAAARLDEHSRPRPKVKSNSSSSSLTASVKQEMASEKQALEEAHRLAEIYGEKKEKVLEVSPVLKIENVRFTCELFEEDPPALGTHAETEKRIRDYLVQNLPTDPIHAGALCIHSFEKSSEVRQACLDTLLKLMDNLLQSPDNPKFRRIRLKNKLIQQRIVAVLGAVEFLEGVGFEKRSVKVEGSGEDEEEEVLTVGEDIKLSEEHITECKDSLLNAEPIRPQLYRSTTVFCARTLNPHALARVDLPQEFYRISAEELKKEQEIRQQAVEQMGMLRTKAMREREAQRELRRYRYCLIRIRFPDNVILQGIFFAHDKVTTLTTWVRNCLNYDFVPFRLATPSGQKIDTDSEDGGSSLAELGLAPAAVLNFEFDQEVLRDVLIGPGGGPATAVVKYLKDYLMEDVAML